MASRKEELKKFREKQALEKAAALKKKKKRNTILTIIVSSFAVIALGLAIIFDSLISGGYFMRKTVSMESPNFKVNNSMMTYFLHANAISFANQNADYLEYLSLDIETDLKYQQSPYGEGSWFDYFLETTIETVEEMLLYYEAAVEMGITPTKDFTEQADSFIDSIKEAAKDEGVSVNSYIESLYGNGVREQDIRRCLELAWLSTESYSEISKSLNYTPEEIDNYFNANKKDHAAIDYISFKIESELTDDDEYGKKKEEADKNSELAKKLAAASSPEAFLAVAKTINSETTLEKMETKTQYRPGDSDLYNFLYDENTKTYDTYIDTEDGLSFTVYMVTRSLYAEDYITKNVRHILIMSTSYDSDEKAKAKAEEVYEEFKNGDKTTESFIKLAQKYSEDTGSSQTGGLYENIYKGEMVEEFDEWCFDETRNKGDHGIVKTTYGYHIMFFEGDGELFYRTKVKTTMQEEETQNMLDDFAEKFGVNIYKEKMKNIGD